MSDMHESSKYAHRRELVLLDENNPRSLVRLLPDSLGTLIRALYNGEKGELLGMTEGALKCAMGRVGKSPTPTDNRIRMQFWMEYDSVQIEDRKPKLQIDMTKVIGRQISKESFYKFWITDPYKLAWMICPPVDYLTALQDALQKSTEKLTETIEKLQPVKDNGDMNLGVIREIQTIDKTLFQRYSALLQPTGVPSGKTKKSGGGTGAAEPEADLPVPKESPEEKRARESRERRERIAKLKAEAEKVQSVLTPKPTEGSNDG